MGRRWRLLKGLLMVLIAYNYMKNFEKNFIKMFGVFILLSMISATNLFSRLASLLSFLTILPFLTSVVVIRFEKIIDDENKNKKQYKLFLIFLLAEIMLLMMYWIKPR